MESSWGCSHGASEVPGASLPTDDSGSWARDVASPQRRENRLHSHSERR